MNAPRPISDEPLINSAHRVLPDLAFAGYILLLVYGSFVPFDFGPPRAPLHGRLIAGMAIGPLRLADIVFNILLYAPAGAGLYALLRYRFGVGRLENQTWLASVILRLAAALLAVAVAAVLSYGIERAQGFVRSRISTWVDVAANVIGAGLGAFVAIVCESKIREITARTRRHARENFLSAAAYVLVAALFIIHLRPYDVAIDPVHAAATAARSASINPLAGWNRLPAVLQNEITSGRLVSGDLTRLRSDYLVDRITDTGSYAFVTTLFLLSRIYAGGGRLYWRLFFLRKFTSAGALVISTAATITLLRIFIASHGFDAAHLWCGLVGWILGAAGTVIIVRQNGMSIGPEGRLPESFWGPAMTVVVVVAVISELVPFDLGSQLNGRTAADRVCWVPFLSHFQSCPADAVLGMSSDLLRFGFLSAIMAMMLHHRSHLPWRAQLAACVGAASLMAVLFESLHYAMPSRSADVTTIPLAAFAALTGAVVVRWTRDYYHSLYVRQAEDLLTTQLIGGSRLPSPHFERNDTFQTRPAELIPPE